MAPRLSTVRLLDRRTLGRTLLARQGLLERSAEAPADVIGRLVGVQAQEPIDPYVALWTRIRDFDPLTLSDGIAERRFVRIGLMRTTLHLVTADDAQALHPIMIDVLRRAWRSSSFKKTLGDVELEPMLGAARHALEAGPTTPSDLGRILGALWPDRDANAMAYLARFLLPLVQVPPRGLWRQTGRAANTTLEVWTGRQPEAAAIDDVVLRYLRAFGPATSGDLRTWSWLTGLRPVLERLRPQLCTYRDERGRELFDVADGMITDPATAAPVRFLPQYDNVFLSHDDRSRINGAMSWGLEFGGKGVVLVDGSISGAWRVKRAARVAMMTVELGRVLTMGERTDLEAEAEGLGGFLDPDGPRDLRIVDVGAD
ncbi:MAG: winged helix DNA-binding domain-containing protein [Candidatus Limnocylindrales bacterium]